MLYQQEALQYPGAQGTYVAESLIKQNKDEQERKNFTSTKPLG